MPRTRRARLSALTTLLSVVAASASAYAPPRLDDGRPDLQGIWVAYNRTPLVRPDSLTELYITAEQAREIEARGNARERDLSIPNETPEFFDERRVALFSESLHDARILRLGGEHPPAAVDSFAGASIARWDGDTLEVETRNFKADQNRAGDFLISSQTVIVERFTLTSYDELNYVFTISDPVHYAQPWTGETQYLRSKEAIFEDACHEGTYSLKHILEGGRVRDGTLR